MITQPTNTIAAQDAHLLPYAEGVITYAHTNMEFAAHLQQLITEQNWPATDVITTTTANVEITEVDLALRTVTWLISETDQTTPYTQALLQTFAASYKAPKNFVVMGLGMTVVPGLTIGNPSIKKKTKSHLQVLVAADYAETLTPEKLATVTTETSQTLIAKELRLAGGTITRLHPDSADWVMGDPATKVQIVSAAELTALTAQLKTDGLSHHVAHDGTNVKILAVSPAVPDDMADIG